MVREVGERERERERERADGIDVTIVALKLVTSLHPVWKISPWETLHLPGQRRCPLNSVFRIRSIVYKATVVAGPGEDQRNYTGLAAQTFKQRFNSHQPVFSGQEVPEQHGLSKHIWSPKEKDADFEIKWEVQKKATEYQNATGRVNLSVIIIFLFLFIVLRKKGSKTKERMKEEEIEKGDCGPPTRSLFFVRFLRTWTSGT